MRRGLPVCGAFVLPTQASMTKIPVCLRRGDCSLTRFVQAAVIAISAFTATVTHLTAAETVAPAAAGVISGIVTNQSTGNGLEEAKVEIPQLGVSTLVDKTGRYQLRVPAGSHELVVSYTGMDTQRSTVNVAPGATSTQNFVLTSPVLMLDAFKVAAEKEGLSAALTQQRNADNLKNVASMDALADSRT